MYKTENSITYFASYKIRIIFIEVLSAEKVQMKMTKEKVQLLWSQGSAIY
ncbi:hypothetical protein QGM71_19575 [Virgibacillus sp. C22-A2]|uniref:Uncharacterized protein n=1 Tax=Virgibacillus tibetensis TaxID=3042313 RepID=A0ABU6KKL4_9BACI|nr:hypothetical protein [Virgibacillus sp. C22-A2]